MDLNALLALVIVGVIPLLVLGLVLLVMAGVFKMVRGSFGRGTVNPLALIGLPLALPFAVKQKIRARKRKHLALPMLALFGTIFLIGLVAQPGSAAVSLNPSDGKVSVMTGIPVSMDVTGLAASTTYKIYLGNDLHKVISTGSSETTKSFTIIFTTDGEFNVSIRDETGVTYNDSLIMYAENPFSQILYVVIPLLLGAGAIIVLVGGFGLVLAAIRAKG